MKEIYLDIKGYEGSYQVSNLGNIRNNKGQILKPYKNQNGYMMIKLFKDGKRKSYFVHRLVLETFKANPDNKPQVNHLDENPLNNNLNNLSWCTISENINYGTRNERVAAKKSIPVYCITNDTVYQSAAEAARKLKLNRSNINMCCTHKRKSTGGYKFKYYNDKEVE